MLNFHRYGLHILIQGCHINVYLIYYKVYINHIVEVNIYPNIIIFENPRTYYVLYIHISIDYI